MTELGIAWLILDEDHHPVRDSEGWMLNFDSPVEAEQHAEAMGMDVHTIGLVEAQCWVNQCRHWWIDLHSEVEWPAQSA